MKECPKCLGTGDAPGIPPEREYSRCDTCGGTGEILGEEVIAERVEILKGYLKEEISAKTNMRKYHREIKEDVWVDVYDVLTAFDVNNPATAHALKKLLAAGGRGFKSEIEDLKEAIVSLNRAVEIESDLNARKASKLHTGD